MDQAFFQMTWADIDGEDDVPYYWISINEETGSPAVGLLPSDVPRCDHVSGLEGCEGNGTVASVEQSAYLFNIDSSMGWIFPSTIFDYEDPPLAGVFLYQLHVWISDESVLPYEPTNDSVTILVTLVDINGMSYDPRLRLDRMTCMCRSPHAHFPDGIVRA